MAFTLSTIRAAIKAQLTTNIGGEINVDVDGAGMPAPVIRFELTESPNYWGTFGPNGMCSVAGRFLIDPAGVDQSAVLRLDEFLSVGTGNGSSLVDAIYADVTFGNTISTLTIEPGDYDADNVTAELLVTFIAMKQGANA
jgi:hypothetical protein